MREKRNNLYFLEHLMGHANQYQVTLLIDGWLAHEVLINFPKGGLIIELFRSDSDIGL